TLESRKLVMVNDAFLKILQYDRDELIGTTSDKVGLRMKTGSKDKFYEMLKEKNAVLDYEVSARDTRGDIHDMLFSSSIIQYEGSPHIFTMAMDVTKRKGEEEERSKALKLDSLGRLSAGIAHDCNNILTILMNNVDLLRVQTPGVPKENFERMTEAVNRGRDMVRNILLFSQGLPVSIEAVDMAQIVDNTIKILGNIDSYSIKVTSSMSTGLWSVHGNPTQLQQVIMNLLDNALEAVAPLMLGDGKVQSSPLVTVSADNIEVPMEFVHTDLLRRGGEFVRITVTDNGYGMDPETVAKVFDPYFTTKSQGRSGLGLATAYGIVRRHGGWIDVQSEPGQGATFRVYLSKGTELETVKKVESRGFVGGTETILVVDDEVPLADSTREMLEVLGYNVFVAYSAEKALKIYSQHSEQIGVMLVDVVMPGMSGIELLNEIRKEAPTQPIVLTSGNMGQDAQEKISNDRYAAFLPKPYVLEVLSDLLRKSLGDDGTEVELKQSIRRLRFTSVNEDTVPYAGQVTSPDTVYDIFKHMTEEPREKFVVVLLNTRREIIAYDELAQGTHNEVIVYAQEILKTALITNADSVILVHNHPSGSLEPSKEDVIITAQVFEHCNAMNIELADHLIVGRDGYFSFRKENLL
ncbi:JAB domain-containing protein, partial [Nitrospirota bacterium]